MSTTRRSRATNIMYTTRFGKRQREREPAHRRSSRAMIDAITFP